jgi:hypothetical protein
MPLLANAARVVHVRVDGRSYDLPVDRLGLGDKPTDDQIKRALAGQLDVSANSLVEAVVDRHPNGNLTVRPEAVFG